MNQFKFTKMHGLGNNYIYVDLFHERLSENLLSSIAIDVSNPNTGIGSDGLILICPSEKADVKMRIFNNDGSEARNCGNGLRCVAKYVFEHAIVDKDTFTIETLGGNVHATVHPSKTDEVMVTINMGEPRLKRSDLPMAGSPDDQIINETLEVVFPEMKDHEWKMTGVSMGNPHAVFFIKDIDKAPVRTFGPFLEKHHVFPEGVNVEFVEVINNKELHFRVWERGSGITQACGTGACAAVVAAVLNGKTTRDQEVTVHLSGGDLFVTWTAQGEVLMAGPAVTICEGTYYYNK
ncbi:diaminopimelate epimerase [Alkalihalobacillus sp. AL-G]|uniref:diaminopimelate epimerase n=1 Tax=Alkalihalobacillus sp. AL-G TaxID=2926399 RepID=UPI00272A8BCE|nr:diaminopimelate epimerase [Alkalihalobacillus sp. AL-G]WLD92682.1 diaminopimelate epimerase [Alkalihalobacillus sp. AL-G]